MAKFFTMDKQVARKSFLAIVAVFAGFNGFLIFGKELLEKWGADRDVLIIGHTLIFLLTALTYSLHVKALNKKTSMGFVNAVYGGMLIKMFGCLIAAFIYIIVAKSGVNKPALFGCMFFYLLYTFLETRIATKLNSLQKKNG